jgi:hypothetical protein
MTTTDWLKHYREVYATEINRLKLSDTVGFAFSGPMFVPTPQAGQLALGWSMMLTLKHRKLLGQPDIGVHIPVIGMIPEDNVIRKGAEFLLENAREERLKLESVPMSPPEEGVLEGTVIPRQGSGAPVPAGLLPAGIGANVAQRRVQQPVPNGGVPTGFKAEAKGVATDLEGRPLDEQGEPKPDENIKDLPNRVADEPVVTDSDSGNFKIVDRRRR